MASTNTSERYRVSWKDEMGEIGPCVIWDLPAYRAWREENGLEPDGIGVPFGSKPTGLTELGWISYAEALAVAERHSVPFDA